MTEEANFVDRRSSERLEIKLQIKLKTADQFIDQYIKDISLTGIFILYEAPSPVGTEIELIIPIGDEFGDIHIEGEVIHSLDDVGMGIRFTRFSPNDKGRLGRFIDHLKSQQSIPEAKQ